MRRGPRMRRGSRVDGGRRQVASCRRLDRDRRRVAGTGRSRRGVDRAPGARGGTVGHRRTRLAARVDGNGGDRVCGDWVCGDWVCGCPGWARDRGRGIGHGCRRARSGRRGSRGGGAGPRQGHDDRQKRSLEHGGGQRPHLVEAQAPPPRTPNSARCAQQNPNPPVALMDRHPLNIAQHRTEVCRLRNNLFPGSLIRCSCSWSSPGMWCKNWRLFGGSGAGRAGEYPVQASRALVAVAALSAGRPRARRQHSGRANSGRSPRDHSQWCEAAGRTILISR